MAVVHVYMLGEVGWGFDDDLRDEQSPFVQYMGILEDDANGTVFEALLLPFIDSGDVYLTVLFAIVPSAAVTSRSVIPVLLMPFPSSSSIRVSAKSGTLYLQVTWATVRYRPRAEMR